jgi:hypothetical protein
VASVEAALSAATRERDAALAERHVAERSLAALEDVNVAALRRGDEEATALAQRLRDTRMELDAATGREAAARATLRDVEATAAALRQRVTELEARNAEQTAAADAAAAALAAQRDEERTGWEQRVAALEKELAAVSGELATMCDETYRLEVGIRLTCPISRPCLHIVVSS